VLRELCAVPIDYKNDEPVRIALDHTGGTGVDAVLDLVGGENLERSSEAARPFGRLTTVLAPAGELNRLYQQNQQNQQLHGIMLTRERHRLEELTPLFERGQVKPLVQDVLPLEQVRQAHKRLDSGHGKGKTVLDFTASSRQRQG
jgi:NADPH:quinone reductase-like Zn-dependent oxidoreductase